MSTPCSPEIVDLAPSTWYNRQNYEVGRAGSKDEAESIREEPDVIVRDHSWK